MKILAHTAFIGTTGYANHARSFFCALNKYHTVKVRNMTIGGTWKGMNNTPHDNEPYITKEMKDMLILQTLFNNDDTRSDFPMYNYKGDFKPDVHIVLNDMNNYQFYDEYDGYKIAFNVYESTRYPDHFFNQLMKFDEVWVPTQWQFDSLLEQGCPIEKLRVVPEGVDIGTFKPIEKQQKRDKFRFLLFGRWDYRKSTTEIMRTFGETFKGNNNVEMLCSIENPYSDDETKTTADRVKKHNIYYDNIKYVNFPSRKDYIKYLQEGDVFVSCARSEGWNLPLIEAMSCGTPSIYSNWGGQLQFAQDKGIPVKISHIRQAHIYNRPVEGEYCEPDFDDLAVKMLDAYENYEKHKIQSLKESLVIHDQFNWDHVAKIASDILEKKEKEFVFVTTGDIGYMPLIEKLVKSLNEFSKSKILVYGVNCEVPFESPNMIKGTITPPKFSEHDKWYWKQYSCIEATKENYEYFVWIDGDVVVNYNIDTIQKYFPQIENYPISDTHIQDEFFGFSIEDGVSKSQLFNERLSTEMNITRANPPVMHVCMYIFNKRCDWWFEEIIKTYNSIDLSRYKTLLLWNDEGIDNLLRWKYGYKKHLPVSNFDTSSYDGDYGYSNATLRHFYKFWNEEGPQNFNRIYGWEFIPKDKSTILYFHGNKDLKVADKMIEFIKMKRDNSFYDSHYFYTDEYTVENLGEIWQIEGGTMEIAQKYGWKHAIYHEIYNLMDYYNNREKVIKDGDVVVDIGANMGVFNRWAYTQGASQVISFEPDKRYYKLLKLNADPRSILFNSAIADVVGTITLHESSHFGGSNVFWTPDDNQGYPVRCYSLDYFFSANIFDHIDFLKLDIEGAEQLAFKGISDDNLMKVKNIAMEYHHSHLQFNEEIRTNLITRLNKLGFNSHILFLGPDTSLQLIYFTR